MPFDNDRDILEQNLLKQEMKKLDSDYSVLKNTLKIRFKKLHPDAVIPKKAHSADAGFDLTATSVSVGESKYTSGCMYYYGTGIAVEIPKGYVGLVFPRSSIYKTGLQLTNSVGVIDSGYTGEIRAVFKREVACPDPYSIGDRIAQLIVIPIPEIEFVEVNELSQSERGTGGYGSTGR